MGFRYWNGTQWVRISVDEAKVRWARGDRVIERPAAAVAPKATKVKPDDAKLDNDLGHQPAAPSTKPPALRPSAPVPTGAAVLETIVGSALAPKPADELDLTDAELEKLTAPDANKG